MSKVKDRCEHVSGHYNIQFMATSIAKLGKSTSVPQSAGAARWNHAAQACGAVVPV